MGRSWQPCDFRIRRYCRLSGREITVDVCWGCLRAVEIEQADEMRARYQHTTEIPPQPAETAWLKKLGIPRNG